MVDVVANNLAWAGNGNTVDYSKLKPFDNGGYYHPFRLLSDDPLNQTCVKQVGEASKKVWNYCFLC